MFKIDYFSRDNLPELTIELIGSLSIDGDLQYHADLSQLKYYIPPPDPNNLCYDLNCNATSTHYKSNSYMKLDDILRWILDNFNQLSKPLSTNEGHWLDIDFVCRPGALKTIFSSPYNTFKGWIICASKYRGMIYLCEFYTDEGNSQQINKSKGKLSRGYKFTQYVVADHPSHKPDLSVPLNEYEEFRCVFKTKFGNHSLLYGSKIDSIYSEQPIKDTLIGKPDLFKFIELKTLPYGKSSNLYGKLYPNWVLGWWSYNYLAGIDTTICGFKDGSTVRMIKEYPTHILPQFSKVKCDVNKCKMFCQIFLDYVKKIVIKDHDECMYKFHWDPSTKNIVHYSEEHPNNELYFFLKPWFVDAAEKYRK